MNIHCRFCGKTITNTDTVCSHCGRVLGTPAAVTAVNANFGIKTQGVSQTAAPVRAIPDTMPQKNAMAELFSKITDKIMGVCLAGSVYAAGMCLSEIVQSSGVSEDTLTAAVGLVIAYVVLTNIRILIRFLRTKKFIRKNGYQSVISNDTVGMANAIAAYQLNPSFWMVRYIRRLNADSGEKIASILNKQRQEQRKKRIGYIPYLLFLTAGFGLLGYLQLNGILYETGMIVAMHVLAFLVCMIYCKVKGKERGFKNYTVILFFAGLMAFTDISYGYHVLICILSVLLGGKLGEKMHK